MFQDDGEFKIILDRGLFIYLGELNDFYEIIYEYILFWTYFYFPKVTRIFYLIFYYKPYSCNNDSRIFIYFYYYSLLNFLVLDYFLILDSSNSNLNVLFFSFYYLGSSLKSFTVIKEFYIERFFLINPYFLNFFLQENPRQTFWIFITQYNIYLDSSMYLRVK